MGVAGCRYGAAIDRGFSLIELLIVIIIGVLAPPLAGRRVLVWHSVPSVHSIETFSVDGNGVRLSDVTLVPPSQ